MAEMFAAFLSSALSQAAVLHINAYTYRGNSHTVFIFALKKSRFFTGKVDT